MHQADVESHEVTVKITFLSYVKYIDREGSYRFVHYFSIFSNSYLFQTIHSFV